MWPRLLTKTAKIALAAVFLATVSVLAPTQTQAQTASLSLWPPLLTVVIQPGKTATQVFRLKNLGDDAIITANVVPFSPADELGHVQLNPDLAVSNFFFLQNADLEKSLPASFPLKAGQTQELVLKIRIPNSQPEADHYFTLLFTANTKGLISGSGSVAQASIGANLLLTISKDGQPQRIAKIEEFKTLSPIIDSFSPISFLLRVKNTGSARFQAVGQIKINNTFNRQVATLALRPDNILTGSIRRLTIANNPSQDGTIAWKPFFPLGRYTATAAITPRDSTNTVSQTIRFFVFPYKALLALLIFLALLNLKSLKKRPIIRQGTEP